MSIDISEQQWHEIDALLFEDRPLLAVVAIRASVESSLELRMAADIMHERYRKLRAEQPERFDCDEKSYWDGWYS